ncbi:hypothetical protein ACS5NO_32275 [Larkinella sp. GY13]|uniref:hypothetical protein n=1 Tax=Larkinella sp. GY13 TaxID=3453720 RepID=UPI003EEE27EB
MNLTPASYTMFCALLLFILYFIVVNSNVKKKPKAEIKPKIKPIQLFDGTNGMPEEKIKKLFKLK